MILTEKKYIEDEYEGLVMELLQSPDIDAELQYYPQSILNSNPNFYLLMFRAVGKIREAATQSNDASLIAALNPFEAKLYEYTNVIPTDLPTSILNDRHLVGRLLADHRTLSFQKDDWSEFQNYIGETVDSIPKKLELPFLEWCVKMLKMNLAKHNKKCTNPTDCGINKGYDRRLQFLERLIGEARSKYRPPVPVYPQHGLPNFSNNPPAPLHKTADKIQWLGTQKEMAELFIRLKAKGWIADFEPETIKDCFTNANTIHQYLKPGEYTEDLGGTFEQVFTPEYSPKFHGISPNTKRNK